MREVALKDGTKALESFHWPEVQNDIAMLSSSKDYRTWVYSDKKKKFITLKGRKLQSHVRGRMFSFPKSYKGKRLTKHETLFLLNTRRQWGDYVTAKPEYVDALLAMHRFNMKRNRVDGLQIGTTAAVILTVLSLPFGIAFPAFIENVSMFLIGSAVLSSGGVAWITWVMNRMDSSDYLFDVWRNANKEHLHPDFIEFHDYLKGWGKLSDEQRKTIGAVSPDPRHLEEYRKKSMLLPKPLTQVKELTTTVPPIGSWNMHHRSFDAVKKEWAEWEMDILKVVQYPALFDMREPATISFHRTLLYAESMKPVTGEQYSVSHPFIKTVADLQLAWATAKSESERIQQSNFKDDERVRLSRALDLLRIALNVSGTPAERQASYKRAMKQLEGLVRVPVIAVESLESGMGLKALE